MNAKETDANASQRPPGGAASDFAIELRRINKRFGPVWANRDIDLKVRRGTIHGIVGENGAGKSTLIKLLTGVTPRTAGEIIWQGRPTDLSTPTAAIALGINAVHQEVVLCPHLTVAANIFLGDEKTARGLLRDRAMVRDAQKILDDLGFNLPASVALSTLTIGQQQLIATARAANRGVQFLIFDEPTAYLTRQEAAQLFALIRRLKAQGVTVVVYPEQVWYGHVTVDDVTEIVDKHLVGGEPVERLMLPNQPHLTTSTFVKLRVEKPK